MFFVCFSTAFGALESHKSWAAAEVSKINFLSSMFKNAISWTAVSVKVGDAMVVKENLF